MKKMNQNGFAAIEAVLILAIVAIVGFTGWFVWHAKQSTDKSLENAVSSRPALQKKATNKTVAKPADETSNWQSYTTRDGKISLKYPGAWVTPDHPELCSENLVLLGTKMSDGNTTVGKCAADGPKAYGQIFVYDAKTEGDNNCASPYGNMGYNVTESTTVSVSGMSAKKTSKVSTKSDAEAGDWPVGTKAVVYCLENDGFTYFAAYFQAPGYPDVLTDFNLMVTKTLILK